MMNSDYRLKEDFLLKKKKKERPISDIQLSIQNSFFGGNTVFIVKIFSHKINS